MEVNGSCPICGPDALFVARDSWLRDSFACTRCHSLPRERAMMVALDMYRPDWQTIMVHECSPVWRGVSSRLRNLNKDYSFSYFDPNTAPGAPHFAIGASNQNIENMTFEDGTFDLFLAQDVFEHIFRPDLAIREIERVLKHGGACIMTVPMVNLSKPNERRAERVGDEVKHYKPASFHGDPVNANGALVTVDWGFDACAYLAGCCRNLQGAVLVIDDLSKGIRAAYNEVLVFKKGIGAV